MDIEQAAAGNEHESKGLTDLIAAIPAVAHEVEGELLLARLVGGNELQFAGGLLLQRHPLDDQAGVVLWPAHQKPPVLLFPSRVPDGKQRTLGSASQLSGNQRVSDA